MSRRNGDRCKFHINRKRRLALRARRAAVLAELKARAEAPAAATANAQPQV